MKRENAIRNNRIEKKNRQILSSLPENSKKKKRTKLRAILFKKQESSRKLNFNLKVSVPPCNDLQCQIIFKRRSKPIAPRKLGSN